jgi:MSHA biogenesis protein MshI
VQWLRKVRRESGWMVFGMEDAELAAVLGAPGTGRAQVQRYAVRAFDSAANGLQKAGRDLDAERYQCVTLLGPDDYQIVVVDAPNVPPNELKTAMRWRVKDLLDLHIDDVTLDVLDIPVPKDAPVRNHSMYAVAGRNEAIQRLIKRFEEAAIPLSVIDIPETAQRNIAALYEDPERAAALLYFDQRGGLLTVNYGGELYLTRRFEVPLEQLTGGSESAREDARGRVLLELQRSLDHFDRQFRSIPISKLLMAPEPTATGLAQYLASGSGLAVKNIDLNEVMDIAGGPLDARVQWRLFHLIGASLRKEVKAL